MEKTKVAINHKPERKGYIDGYYKDEKNHIMAIVVFEDNKIESIALLDLKVIK